jgi:hypothetical protein
MTHTRKNPFYPKKYYQGLTRKKKQERLKEIQKFGALSWKNPRAYQGFRTDRNVVGKPSSYTQTWKSRYPKATSMTQKSKVSGVPLRYLDESYRRGMAAWRTGHRPGATEQQWGYARVHSLLLCGKTYHSTDSDIVRRAKQHSKKAREWWKSCPTKSNST